VTLLAKILQAERPIIVRDGGSERLREIWALAGERGEDGIARRSVREVIAFNKAKTK
jgi:hypothetical protein